MLTEDRAGVFEALLRAHEGMVLRVAYRMLGRREDAEDAAQEVFLRLHRNLGAIDLAGAVQSWLYKTTMNVCYDVLRRRKPAEALAENYPREARQERDLVEAEKLRLLAEALATLPERERAAVVLRDVEGLPTREVALILGVEEVTVRTQVSSAKAKLRRWMEKRLER